MVTISHAAGHRGSIKADAQHLSTHHFSWCLVPQSRNGVVIILFQPSISLAQMHLSSIVPTLFD
jgi:hypothetical protein